MKRRCVCLAPLAALVAPRTRAEDGRRRPAARLGFLGLHSPQSYAPLLGAFLQGLAELGWRDNIELRIDYRWAQGDEERMPSLAAELAARRPAVIVTHTAAGIRAAQRATSTIPIVMGVASDPVAMGFITSLARPGGNITGVSSQIVELAPKRLELLKEAIPALRTVAVLLDAGNPASRLSETALRDPARRLGVSLWTLSVDATASTIESSLVPARERADGLIVEPYPLVTQHMARIIEFARSRRLPTIGGLRSFVEAGGLLAYNNDFADGWRLAARYVHRILTGAKPAELPVEQPTKLELSLNAKTARALGISVPQSMLVRADFVIP